MSRGCVMQVMKSGIRPLLGGIKRHTAAGWALPGSYLSEVVLSYNIKAILPTVPSLLHFLFCNTVQ
jgi:hypothetical protein